MAQQLAASGEEVGLLALVDSRHPAQPIPRHGFEPRYFARRVVNQCRIVGRLGVRDGASYLRRALRIARREAAATLRAAGVSWLPAWAAQRIHEDAVDLSSRPICAPTTPIARPATPAG